MQKATYSRGCFGLTDDEIQDMFINYQLHFIGDWLKGNEEIETAAFAYMVLRDEGLTNLEICDRTEATFARLTELRALLT